ncbi:protein FAM111A-like [Gouania willdenowi]|uniref:Protein FAM111A-like n=1 Tax=Gouania willdenowi TaxID=441366 RepID=A0A8C5HKL0_GOUWI|nr:protein FAM111A-like [Gouania willdenowi]
MPHKRGRSSGPGTGDIRKYFNNKTADPSSPVKVKEEKTDPVDGHSHTLNVKFSSNDRYEYSVHCEHPRTVLQVLKSHSEWNAKMADDGIIIHMGKGDKETIIPTHFPCTCLEEGETLTLYWETQEVEQRAEGVDYTLIRPVEEYSVFFIDTVGGVNSRSKELFRNQGAVKMFKFLCVYGEKGATVMETFRRDGRFLDYLESFKLSNNDNENTLTVSTEKVKNLHNNKFKIRLPLNKSGKDGKNQEDVANKSVKEVADMRGRSVASTKTSEGTNTLTQEKLMEIYELLCEQFPHLKEEMENRAEVNTVKVEKVNFGKAQQSFSEVFRQKQMHKLGESVCKVRVGDVCSGTGFVLFDNYIITNAHLFQNCTDGRELHDEIDVFALFNYVDPEPYNDFYCFEAEKLFVDIDSELDYAIVELHPEGWKQNGRPMKVPKGLLNKFGPLPETGEACIIGHPKGEILRMDPTWIIEKEKRKDVVKECLEPYRKSLFPIRPLINHLNDQGLQDLLESEEHPTYNTFLYHGASGSPVIDGHGRVFGLHTAGLMFNKPTDGQIEYVIEYAQPLIAIFEKFVNNLKSRTDDPTSQGVLAKVKEVAKNNKHIQILDLEEAMDTS